MILTEQYIPEFQRKIVDKEIWRACINCEHWKSSEEICAKWKARPPADTIVLSCPAWQYRIPF